MSTGKRNGRNINNHWSEALARIFKIMKQSRRETMRNLAQPQP